MTSPIGMAEYFAMEAGEYLDRLHGLVTGEAAPTPEDLVRYCRALRGSALMANQPHVARAASGLEALAKAYREGRHNWDDDLRRTLTLAVDELRQLVRRAGTWGEEETARADRLARELEGRAGIPSPAGPRVSPYPVEGGDTEAGVRAFVAREGALAAGALDRAARALRSSPDGREPLYAVLRRLQSLRGLAAMSELTPLPELLETIEHAVGEMTRMFAPPPEVADVFEAAAHALSRCARDVAREGRPVPDAEETGRFANLMLHTFAAERDVVPIDSLFPENVAGVVKEGIPPQHRPEGQLGTVEMVGLGEYLSRAAEELSRAGTPVVVDLRLYTTAATLTGLVHGAGTLIPGSLRKFAQRARVCITRDEYGHDIAAVAAIIRDAGTLLRESALAERPPDDEAVNRLLDRVTGLGARSAPRTAEAEDAAVPIESLEYEAPEEGAGLVGSFVTLDRLRRERPGGVPSLEALLGDGSREQGAGRREQGEGRREEEGVEVVEIDTLCYTGRGALLRAREISLDIEGLLEAEADLMLAQPLMAELRDLMAIALEESAAAG